MIWLAVGLFVVLSAVCFYLMNKVLTDESCPGASLTDAMAAMFFLAGGAAFGFCALVILVTLGVMALL